MFQSNVVFHTLNVKHGGHFPKYMFNMMKFTRAISRVKWLSGEQTVGLLP